MSPPSPTLSAASVSAESISGSAISSLQLTAGWKEQAMEWIGELERAFAAQLYPWRYAIAAGAAAVLVVLAVVARRRRWDLAARRHPRQTLGILAVALAIGVPTGWYLGSPLFIRVELNEPAPVTAVASSAPATRAPSLAAVDPSPAPSASALATPMPTPTFEPTATPFAPRTLATGSFKGADSFHFGRGSASLIEFEPGSLILRFDGFSVRNGPDLYVYLSPSASGYTRSAVELGRLKATAGSFNYALPAGVDLSATRSVVVWCKQFSVLFATAPLTWS
jgi:hypothetical protein